MQRWHEVRYALLDEGDPNEGWMLIDRPIVLLASERSGGNLLRAILGSHSTIAAPSPVHFLLAFDPLVPSYGPLDEDENFRQACDDVSSFFEYQVVGPSEPLDASVMFEHAQERSLVGLMDAAFSQVMRSAGATRVVLKENEAFRHAHRLARFYPGVRFVYLVRDGRDVALSWLESPNHLGGIHHIATTWRDEQRACLSLLCDPGLAGSIHVVHYEDLITESRDVVRALCDFVEVDFEQPMLEFHTRGEIREQSASVRNWENIGKPIMRENFDKHQEGLGWWRAQTFNQVARRELVALGYDVPKASAFHAMRDQLRNVSREGLGLTGKATRGHIPKVNEVLVRAKRRRHFQRIVSDLEARQKPRWPRGR